MSAARAARRAGRNLLIALLIGALIIVAIVIAYVAGRNTSTPSAGPTSSSVSSSSTSTSPGATSDAAPTGCLGGQERNVVTVLAAQRLAPNTSFGAVEVAAAFFRWTYRFPVPSAAEIGRSGPLFVPGQSAAAQANLRSDYARNPNPSAGQVPDSTAFNLSTVGGKWISQANSSAGETLVSIQAPFVLDGAVSATKSTTESFRMKWVDSAWRVEGLAKAEPAKLNAGGTAFTAGC